MLITCTQNLRTLDGRFFEKDDKMCCFCEWRIFLLELSLEQIVGSWLANMPFTCMYLVGREPF